MDTLERKQKLQTLPWYALHEIAKKMCIDEKEINGKEKSVIISKILSYGGLSDEEIEQYVNDYIYGDRVTFTLWTFGSKLEASDYEIIKKLENKEEYIDLSGYRKLKILSVKEYLDRIEILYVYSREYMYIDENGKNANIWEQHRGCLWIGRTETYLACISKHEKMTIYITKYIADVLKNSIVQIKPPKSAIDKCTNFKAISRIVLQGKDGEKTIVSRAGGITIEQEEEIDRIRNDRMDTSGSFISSITSDIEATIKYNVRNGSIGIYKHLPAQVLFKWSENAIGIILEEIENLKGQPAEEIFKEVGQEIKWTGVSTSEITQLNWYLTQVIAALAKYVQDHQKTLVMVNPFSVKKIKELDDNSPKKIDLKDPKTIAKLVVDVEKLLAIKGVGSVTIAGFIAEVGDIRRFKSPKQIQKYAGLELVENSSGKHKGRSRISKRGRRKLRKILYQVMIPLLARNKEFRTIYDYYVTRVKNPLKRRQAMIAVSCKLIRIFYAVLTKGVDYDRFKMMSDIHHERGVIAA